MFNPWALKPQTICILIIALGVFSLSFALIGQYFFGLHPCHLCIYQRWPFGIAIALGIIGLIVPRLNLQMIGLSALAFVTNAGIGLYHSGVERKWWAGLSGCSTPDMSGSVEELIARIQATAVTRCDEIAWSLFGLSMANYNAIMCLVAGLACFGYVFRQLNQAQH